MKRAASVVVLVGLMTVTLAGEALARKKAPTTFAVHHINYNGGVDDSDGRIASKTKCLVGRLVHLKTGGVERASALTDAGGNFAMTGNWGMFGQSVQWTVDAKKTKRFKCLAGSFTVM